MNLVKVYLMYWIIIMSTYWWRYNKKGPVYTITITAQGIVPKGKALCRHSAQDGDWIYVSGTLGDGSAAGLELLLKIQGKRIVKVIKVRLILHKNI